MEKTAMLELRKTPTISERERKLLQKKAKLESDLARLQKAAKDAARRDDTRRKIVLGAALLKGIEENKIPEDIGRRLIANFTVERDRKLFDDFVFRTPESSEVDSPQQE